MGFFDGITQIASGITGAIGDIIDPVSSLLGGGLSYLGTQSQNQQSAANQQAANQFSAQQYATRYQTTVKDLQAAGLNPMLAYSQGAGTAPTGQAAPVQNALAAGVNAAQQGLGRYTAFKNAQADNLVKYNTADNIAADTSLKRAQELVEIEKAPLTREQKNQIKASIGLMQSQTDLAKGQSAHQWALLPRSKQEGKYYDTYGIHPFELRDMATGVNSAANAVNAINPFKRGSRETTINYPTYQKNYYPNGE